MSRKKLKIGVYSNLPSGGAKVLEVINLKYVSNKANIYRIIEKKYTPSNFLSHMMYILFKLPIIHKKLSKKISKNIDCLIVYHTWITKSPHILRYVNIPKIYICHEPLREYYDNMHIENQSIKQKIINTLRYPIKIIDKRNLKSQKLTVIVNSKKSKIIIDKVYGIHTTVIYPGIEVDKFDKVKEIKQNQIISVGAINNLKRFDFLIKVLSKVKRDIRPILKLVGNGYDKVYCNYLSNLAIANNVELIIRVNISENELIKEYKKSLIFAYAPINEPFGIVVEEAMASRLPLVVYGKGGGYAEIINHQNGYKINNMSESIWANAITELTINPDKRNSIGDYNFDYVSSRFNSDNMNHQLWNIIQSL